MNPYAQWQQGGAAPSIFGALPSLPASNPPTAMPDSVTFTFTNFKTTILNSTVFGPQQRTAYRVVTEATAPACTIFKDNESRNVAMVQWQPHATVEIRGVAAKQRVRDWLRLSSDQRRRIMEVRGVQYAWSPVGDFVCLSKVNSTAPRVLARIARVPNNVVLELTQEVMQAGLLEPCLVATVMICCGHNID
ncbi:hypothetical protein C8Q70DRAFT_920493 [Cubamyces menziesii]|uniref:DUF6593 domain-containing protein n=1 Tax=Trametes cubensis TaxID=1111947 RepID=A0AAD7XDC1_9APHY|nr:hypothetical protein C8Q70DRAFT_920493 [Cubamyces menziesii]KAJ8463927.1 hypothetical protein ONZ51_g9925 [Trametes cubensis]KAJ8481853.1 hypothetical protein ONZ51_g5711 [Trametes cubensis]